MLLLRPSRLLWRMTFPGILLIHFVVATSPLAEPLVKRYNSWVYPKEFNDETRSSLCDGTQGGWIVHWQDEAVLLAKAGSEAIGLMIDSFGSMEKFRELPVVDRTRIGSTWSTFFGQITDDDEDEQFTSVIDRATKLKAILDRIGALTAETWPGTIRVACDSTFLREVDDEGNPRASSRHETNYQPPPPGHMDRWDTDALPSSRWIVISDWSDCATHGDNYRAWTEIYQQSGWDRHVFCPQFWMSSTQGNALSQSGADIVDGQSDLTMFTLKGGLMYFHETLHTWSVTREMQGGDGSPKPLDVDGLDSYGPRNAARIALDDPQKAVTNVENIVYFCIAMYFKDFDWSTLTAKRIVRS